MAGSWLDVHVRLGRDVHVDVGLSGDVLVRLYVDVRLGSNLLVNIWLCWDFRVHIWRWQSSSSGDKPKNNLQTSRYKILMSDTSS